MRTSYAVTLLMCMVLPCVCVCVRTYIVCSTSVYGIALYIYNYRGYLEVLRPLLILRLVELDH